MRNFFKKISTVLLISTSSLVSAKTITIGVEDLNYFPYYGKVQDEYEGYARKIFDLFAEKSGHEIKYAFYPVIRLGGALQDGSIDFKFPANPNWAKDSKVGLDITYSDSVCDYIDGVLVREDKLGQDHKTIGIMRGFTPWGLKPEVRNGGVNILEHSVFEGMLKKVLTGRIDGAYSNIFVGAHLQRTDSRLSSMGNLAFDPSVGFEEGSYFLSTIKHKDILKEFNEFLKDNHELINEMQKEYNLDLSIY